jgi:tRNA(fMet)-specific endonuclease VapC
MAELRYLLDTNVVSAIIKMPDGPVARRLASLPRETFAISLVVAAELRYRVIRKGSPQLAARVQSVLENVDVLPLEQPVDQHYGDIRADLARLGPPIGQNDLLIAAHARALGLVLVTNNVREFARVPGLVVENWQAEPGR